jgi:hypothetical protein
METLRVRLPLRYPAATSCHLLRPILVVLPLLLQRFGHCLHHAGEGLTGISSSVRLAIASGRESEQRRTVLNKAKESAEPGKRPKIRTYQF